MFGKNNSCWVIYIALKCISHTELYKLNSFINVVLYSQNLLLCPDTLLVGLIYAYVASYIAIHIYIIEYIHNFSTYVLYACAKS